MEMWRGYVVVTEQGQWVSRLFGSPQSAWEFLQRDGVLGLFDGYGQLLVTEVTVFDEVSDEQA